MKPIISVIVPVYNVERYVKKCLDSILVQTFENIEIIVVDDGSTDSSGVICDEYAKRDNRVHVYHKTNGGLSSARNYGIERATGRYLGFVDSDDYIDPDMYEVLLNNLLKYDADMSLCGLFDVFNGKPRKVNTDNRTFEATVEETIKIVLEAKITSVTAVNKLYKRELFAFVRYPEGKTSEDAFIILDLIMKCKKTVITTIQKYYYIHRPGSITTSHFNPRTLDVLEAYNKNYRIIEANYPKLIDVARMRLCWAHFYVLDRLIFDDTEAFKVQKQQSIVFLKENTSFILSEKRFRITRKLAMILLAIHSNLYKLCVKIQNQRYKVE